VRGRTQLKIWCLREKCSPGAPPVALQGKRLAQRWPVCPRKEVYAPGQGVKAAHAVIDFVARKVPVDAAVSFFSSGAYVAWSLSCDAGQDFLTTSHAGCEH